MMQAVQLLRLDMSQDEMISISDKIKPVASSVIGVTAFVWKKF